MKYQFEKPLPQVQQYWSMLINRENGQSTMLELCATIANFMQQHIELIDRKLIRDLSYISELAYYEKGMQVDRVEHLEGLNFKMFFHYQWTIFQGCMGLHEQGDFKDKVSFTLDQNGIMTFDLTAFEKLSTADEL